MMLTLGSHYAKTNLEKIPKPQNRAQEALPRAFYSSIKIFYNQFVKTIPNSFGKAYNVHAVLCFKKENFFFGIL